MSPTARNQQEIRSAVCVSFQVVCVVEEQNSLLTMVSPIWGVGAGANGFSVVVEYITGYVENVF